MVSPQIKAEADRLGLSREKNKTARKKKDNFMSDLLSFRLSNPNTFEKKAFGSQRKLAPWSKRGSATTNTSPNRLSNKKNSINLNP